MLTAGVFGTSRKSEEKRVSIHPDQLEWIDPKIRKRLFFEEGYGVSFGQNDDQIGNITGGILTRNELFRKCDIAILAKPLEEDFAEMNDGAIHWGWPHCVQQKGITQLSIDKKLTLIAWESMHRWSKHGDWQMHIFHRNNEIAGYAGVLHAMNQLGIDGNYGPNRKAVVISFGSVSRGAIRALQARGIQNITVFTQRHYILVADQMSGINYSQFDEDASGRLVSIHPDQSTRPFIEELQDIDIIVNGILQDTDKPVMFVGKNQDGLLKAGCLIIDISCDEGMGFHFARPTTFDEPILNFGDIRYYAVDHTPSHLWNAASWEISNSLIPYLPIVLSGPKRWEKNETIRRAIEIRDGVVQNPKILSYQGREEKYPHGVM